MKLETHVSNAYHDASSGTQHPLADGTIRVITEQPLLYEVTGQKGIFDAGGAFWFNSIRDRDNRIIAIAPEQGGNTVCFDREDFVARSGFTMADLELVTGEICVSR